MILFVRTQSSYLSSATEELSDHRSPTPRESAKLPSNRTAITVPVDHGLIFQRIKGLETPSAPFAARAGSDITGFMMTPGQVKQTETFFAENPHLSRVLTIDTHYDFTNLDRGGSHALITSVEEAVRMGVDAVKMLFPWAHSWLALTDYAPSVWSGTPFMSDTLAARTAAWDGRTHRWVHGRVSASIGSADLPPPVRRAGDVIGHFVSSNLSVAGVIAPEAVVVAGGHDHPIGGWGVHEMDPHSLLDSMGTAEVVVAQAPSKNVAHGYHIDVAPGIQTTGTTVLSVEELARNVEWAARDTDVRRELDALIAGDRQPDDFLHRAVFLPGSRGGGRPHFTADAPRAAASRASAVLGALARLGQRAQDAVAAAPAR